MLRLLDHAHVALDIERQQALDVGSAAFAQEPADLGHRSGRQRALGGSHLLARSGLADRTRHQEHSARSPHASRLHRSRVRPPPTTSSLVDAHGLVKAAAR